MIKFAYLLLVIEFVLINEIACSDSIQDVILSYYGGDIEQQFNKEWKKYQHAFENAVVSGLQENFGASAINMYVAEKHDAQLIAGGFHLSDGVVNVYFFQMVLRELPALVRPKLNIELSSNYLKFESKVGRMFIDTTYYVARNTSSVIYAHPEDQKALSPFSLQQVDNFGKVAIIAEDCLMSGISIITLSGDSVNLGHSPIQLSDCKFTVEISTPNSGAPPVIAPYFPKGPKEKLEMILGMPIVEELKTKLQGSLYSYVNTSVLFGEQASKFRENQQKLFKSYAEFIRNYVSNLNQKTLKANKGHVGLEDYDVFMDAVSDKIRRPCHLALRGLVLYGLETAYVSRTGGSYNDGTASTTVVDAIVFSSMQIRGKATHDDGNGTLTYDFAAELTDITVNIVINIGKGDTNVQHIILTGWRSLEFSIIPWETHYRERIGYQSLVYGHILNVLPERVIDHLKSVLGDISTDGDKPDGSDRTMESDEGNEGKRDKNKDNDSKSMAVDDDNNGSSNSKLDYDNGKNVDDDKKKEFFTDDNLDKDFFSEDNIEKNFFTDDNIKKDFFTGGNGEDSDDKTGGNKVSNVGHGDEGQVNPDTGDDEDNKDGSDGDDDGVLDSNDGENADTEGKKYVNEDDKSERDNEGADSGKVTASDGGVHSDSDDREAGVDDNSGVADVDMGGVADGGTGHEEKKDFFTDDNIDKNFFTDDNIQKDFMSDDKTDGGKVNYPSDSKGVGSDSSNGAVIDNDKTGNMSSDGTGPVELDDGDVSINGGGTVDVDSNVSYDDKNNAGGTGNLSGDKSFFTDDNIKKDFFTDDNIDKNFFSDDKKSVDKGHNSDTNYPDDQNEEDSEHDEENPVEEDERENPAHSSSDDLDGNNGKKKEAYSSDVIPNNEAEKDFFTDDNIEKDFFTDDNIEKDFFTDDNIEKEFFTDKDIKEDFFADGKVGGNKENMNSYDKVYDKKKYASSSSSDTVHDKESDSSSNKDNDDGTDDNNTNDTANSYDINDSNAEAKAKLKETENKPLSKSKKNKLSEKKPFLDEHFFSDNNKEKNFFSDDNIEKGFMVDGMRRHVTQDNDTANIRSQKKGKAYIDDGKDADGGRESPSANIGNKNANIENLGTNNITQAVSKEHITQNVHSKEVKTNVLPLNVHNARRLDNLHMSENEIR